MAAAAGSALLRAVATKTVARAPTSRLPTSSGGLGLSSFSTSAAGGGSMPPPSGNPSGAHKLITIKFPVAASGTGAMKQAATIAASFLAGCFAFVHFHVNPPLDRIHADMVATHESWVSLNEQLDRSNEKMRAVLHSNKGSQIEATGNGYFSSGRITSFD